MPLYRLFLRGAMFKGEMYDYRGDRLPQAGETITVDDDAWAVEVEQANSTAIAGDAYEGSIVGVLVRGRPPRS